MKLDMDEVIVGKAFSAVPRPWEKCMGALQGTHLLYKSSLEGHIQRVVIKGLMSSWRLVTSGDPHGSVVGPILFNILIKATDNRIACSLSRFADDTKVSGGVAHPRNGMPFGRTCTSLRSGPM